jgi:hypothetical protein
MHKKDLVYSYNCRPFWWYFLKYGVFIDRLNQVYLTMGLYAVLG